MQSHWQKLSELIQNTDFFEPDEAACQIQASKGKLRESWYPVALGGITGTGRLYVTAKPSGSSLYEPDPAVMLKYSSPSYCSLAKVVDVPLLTFSEFIERYRRPVPDLLKLDVQGAELDILQSVRNEHMAGILAVQTEVSFVPFYKNQPLFHDVDAHMRQRGFVMFDLLPSRSYRFEGKYSHGLLRRHLNILKNREDISRRLIEADAFYIREPQAVVDGGDKTANSKLFTILLLYRFLDEALWLAEAGREQGVWSAADATSLVALVKAVAPKPGLRQRADWLGKLARKFSRLTGLGRGRKADYWLDRSWDF